LGVMVWLVEARPHSATAPMRRARKQFPPVRTHLRLP
jgi:hypothetical protein